MVGFFITLQIMGFKKFPIAILIILASFLIACNHEKSIKKEGVKTVKDTVELLVIDELEEINSKIKLDVKNLNLYHQRAYYYQKEGDIKSAVKDMERIIAIDSTTPPYLISAGEFYFQDEQYDLSKKMYEKAILIEANNEEANLKLAEIQFLLGDYKTTVELIDKVLTVNKYNQTAYLMKGYVFLMGKDSAKAASSFETARELDGDTYTPNIELGKLYESSNPKRAIQYYNNAIDIAPLNPEAFYHRGFLYQTIGDYNNAISSYELIIKISENTKVKSTYEYAFIQQAYYNLGYINILQEEYNKAIKMFDIAANLNPTDANAIYNIGLCYEAIGDFKKAEEFYKTALQANPQHDGAAKSLGALYKN